MKTYTPEDMRRFVTESNGIEGITREPTQSELEVSAAFLDLEAVDIPDLERFVSVHQPGARLRDYPGLNVWVGVHYPPPGGLQVKLALEELLDDIDASRLNSYRAHVAYEYLHPFMDGNGRSGRILWAWQMMRHGWCPVTDRSFLQEFYYQSLENSR